MCFAFHTLRKRPQKRQRWKSFATLCREYKCNSLPINPIDLELPRFENAVA